VLYEPKPVLKTESLSEIWYKNKDIMNMALRNGTSHTYIKVKSLVIEVKASNQKLCIQIKF